VCSHYVGRDGTADMHQLAARFATTLFEVGSLTTSLSASTANGDQIKRVKFELYVGRMDMDTGAMGFQ